jgi:hypothetical protein
MKLKVELEIQDVFGGDGFVRTEATTKTTLKRQKTEKATRQSIGVEVTDGIAQEKSETKQEPINTFRFDEDGRPTLRLGGAHGKLWGAMKASAKQLKELGDADFSRYNTLMDMLLVSPVWVVLDSNGGNLRCDAIPQQMAGMSHSMIVQRFDVVPKTTAVVELIFPNQIKRKVEKLIRQLEIGSHLNKRRSIIKVLSITEVT